MYNTVSLEIMMKLKDAGWKNQCTYFCFKEKIYTSELFDRRETNGEYIEAPQIHEILEELPKDCIVYIHGNGLYEASHGTSRKMILSRNPHDAAALLWIWYAENNYITTI